MENVNLLLTDADGNMLARRRTIEAGVQMAMDYAAPRLGIDWGVNVLVTNLMPELILARDGVGGRTYDRSLCVVAADERASKELICETLCHELYHAARLQRNPEHPSCMFDAIINEGLATYFQVERAQGRKQRTIFAETVMAQTDKENDHLLNNIRVKLSDEMYSHQTIFVRGGRRLPPWGGYFVGYYLVKRYLVLTGKSVEEACGDDFDEFLMAL